MAERTLCPSSGKSPDRWPTFAEHQHMACPTCGQSTPLYLRRLDHGRQGKDIYFANHTVTVRFVHDHTATLYRRYRVMVAGDVFLGVVWQTTDRNCPWSATNRDQTIETRAKTRVKAASELVARLRETA